MVSTGPGKQGENVDAARIQVIEFGNRLEALISALTVGVAIVDEQGGNIQANEEYSRIWAGNRPVATVAEYIKYKAWWADTGEPVKPEEWASAQAVLKGEAVTGQIIQIERFDGTRGFVHNSAAPIRNASGRIVGAAIALQDITRVRQAEESLRLNESRFRSVLENTRDVIYLLNLETRRYEYISPSCARIVGFSVDELMEMDVETALTMVHPDDLPAMRAALACLEETGEAEVEYRQRHKEGRYRWLSNRMSLVRDLTGRPLYRNGNIRDITDRKLAEERLRELTQRLTYHVDNSPLAVIEWGSDMRLIRWSQTAERLFGWKAEEVLGKRMEDFRWIYGDDQQQVSDVNNDLQTGRNLKRFSANRNYRKDGSVVQCEWYNSSLLDESGKLRSILSLVLDVTERKQAEEALRLSEERLALAASGTRIGFLDWNVETDEVQATDQVTRLLGLQSTTSTSSSSSSMSQRYHYRQWAERVHPDDLPAVEAEIRRCQEQHKPYEEEYRVIWPDGSVHWLIGRGVFQYGEQGGPSRFLGILMDVTERKEVEEQLRQSERRERERAEELQAILSTVPVPVFIARDVEARQLNGNPAAHLALRLPPGANLSKSAPEGERPTNFQTIRDGVEVPPRKNFPSRKLRGASRCAAKALPCCSARAKSVPFTDTRCLFMMT